MCSLFDLRSNQKLAIIQSAHCCYHVAYFPFIRVSPNLQLRHSGEIKNLIRMFWHEFDNLDFGRVVLVYREVYKGLKRVKAQLAL